MAELGARAPPGSRAEHLPLCHEVTDQGGCFGAYNLPFLRPRGTGLPLSVWLSPPDFTGGTKTRHRLSPRPMLGSASPTTPLLGANVRISEQARPRTLYARKASYFWLPLDLVQENEICCG